MTFVLQVQYAAKEGPLLQEGWALCVSKTDGCFLYPKGSRFLCESINEASVGLAVPHRCVCVCFKTICLLNGKLKNAPL